MLSFYSPVIILQIFCLYHAYSRHSDYKWFWLIIFFPLFGCLIYLYVAFYNQKTIDNLSEGVTSILNKNHKIDQLEKQLKYADTVTNKMQLANEHTAAGNYERATTLYKSCLNGLHDNDPGIITKLVQTSYLNKDYSAAIDFGNQIATDNLFQKSEERIGYAWSLYFNNNLDLAEKNFQEMDIRFSNYVHRLEYAKFLNLTNRATESKEKLDELLDEIDSMDKYEQRFKKGIRREISNYYREV